MKTFTLGATESPKIQVSVLDYEREPIGEWFDDNWVKVQVAVRVGAFSGQFDASFTTRDFVQFRTELQSLFEKLSGQAQFHTLESQLEITLTGDGRGGIEVKGAARDHPSMENELRFEFGLDQTYLRDAIRGLNEIISAFPPRPA